MLLCEMLYLKLRNIYMLRLLNGCRQPVCKLWQTSVLSVYLSPCLGLRYIGVFITNTAYPQLILKFTSGFSTAFSYYLPQLFSYLYSSSTPPIITTTSYFSLLNS